MNDLAAQTRKSPTNAPDLSVEIAGIRFVPYYIRGRHAKDNGGKHLYAIHGGGCANIDQLRERFDKDLRFSVRGISNPITIKNKMHTPDDVATLVQRALDLASTGRNVVIEVER